MKKRTVFLALALCFLFCISILTSGKFLAKYDPKIEGWDDVKIEISDEFYNNLKPGQRIDLTGVTMTINAYWPPIGEKLPIPFTGNNELRIEPETYDISVNDYYLYPIQYEGLWGDPPQFDPMSDDEWRTLEIALKGGLGTNTYNHIELIPVIDSFVKFYRNFDDENDNKLFDLSSITSMGKMANKVQVPSRKGYNFKGYFTERKNGDKVFNNDGTIVSDYDTKSLYSDGCLYAHWEKGYDITAKNTDCEYDGNTKSITPLTGSDALYVSYSYDGGKTYKDGDTQTPFKDIGTYTIPYKVWNNDTFTGLKKSGSITLNIYGSKKSMFMGVSSITGFSLSDNNTFNYIWFGNHEYGSGIPNNEPIKFRVLDNQAQDDYKKSGLFLISEYTVLNDRLVNNDEMDYNFLYDDSNLRSKLYDLDNDDNIYKNAFNNLEKAQIIRTNYNEQYENMDNPFVDSGDALYSCPPTGLSNSDLFLISMEDYVKYFSASYLFKPENLRTRGLNSDWITRSVASEVLGQVPSIKYNKGVFGIDWADKESIFNRKTLEGIRPAMNLKVDDVAFSSTTATKAANNTMVPGVKATLVEEKMKKIEEDTKNTFNSFKLTLFDKDHLKITKENYNPGPDPKNWQTLQIKDIKKDNTITIDGLTTQNTNDTNTLKDNDYVSAIITKPSGEIMYYGRLKTASSVGENGSVNLEIPYNVLPNNQGVDTIDNGDYYLKLFLEEYNGGNNDANETDTCSDFLNFNLEVRTTIEFAQEDNLNLTYNGLGQTIASPSLEINANYVDVEYNLDGKTDENEKLVWSKDKPYVTDVKYADTELKHGPERAKSEVLSYDIKVRVKVKDIYKDHPLLKYYEDEIKDVYLKINPATLDYSAQGVYKTYDGLESHIEVTPYINGAPYEIGYNLDGGKNYNKENPTFKNVNDTATIDAQGNKTNSKNVYFEILACNYEVTHGNSTANIQPFYQSLQVQNVDTPYDAAPHTFNLLNYFPSASELSITYTYKDDDGNQHTDDLNKPEFTKAGEHDVYINLQEKDENGNPPKTSNNYFAITNAKATVTIREANIDYQVEGTEVEYDGEPHTINLFLSYPTISGEGVEVLYSTDNINWQKDKPEFTEANVNDKKNGDTVYYKIEAPNYKTVKGSKKVFITKSKVICSESQQLDVLYDGGQHAASIYLSKPTADKATVLYSKDNGATYTETEPPRHRDVGVYKQYFKVEAGNNYEEYYGNKTLTISPRSIKKAVIETISHRAYTGRPITPSIIINDGTPSIISESDYVVSYSNNVDKGEAKATITGINNYNEQVIETFYITDPDGNSPDDNGGGTGTDSISESSSGGSADLTGIAGIANSLLTGEDIRPLYFLIVVFVLNVCAAIIIYRYKKKRVGD